MCPFPKIGLATGNGLISVCGLPKAGRLQLGPSSSKTPRKSMWVGGFAGATFVRGGRSADGPDDRLGPASGGFAWFTGRRGRLVVDICGWIGGGTGEFTIPGETATSLGTGDMSPA